MGAAVFPLPRETGTVTVDAEGETDKIASGPCCPLTDAGLHDLPLAANATKLANCVRSNTAHQV